MNKLHFPQLAQDLRFYAVVPDSTWVKRMIDCEVETVQLRAKNLTTDVLQREIEISVQAARGSKSQLFINDYWQEAIAANAYGVHLGQEDLDNANLTAIMNAGLRLGISTHSDAELDRALSYNPSYVAVGAVFATTTKQMPTAPQGLERLRHYVKSAGNTPVVAIGGIDLSNAKEVLSCGVASLAVVRAITQSANVKQTVKQFRSLWD